MLSFGFRKLRAATAFSTLNCGRKPTLMGKRGSGVIAGDTRYYLAHLDEKDNTQIPLIGDQGVLPFFKQ